MRIKSQLKERVFPHALRQRNWRATMMRRGLLLSAMLALLATANQAIAQASAAAPEAMPNTLWIPHNATSDMPYTFKRDDFPFNDRDGDTLVNITIKSLPARGTLQVASSAATVNQNVTAANLGDIKYWPEANQEAQFGYTSFTFTVRAGFLDSNEATLSINLRAVAQTPAIGAPFHQSLTTFSRESYWEDEILEGGPGDINDLNGGIDPVGFGREGNVAIAYSWQWQQSPARAGPYADIRGATSTGNMPDHFAPGDEQAEQYVRLCVSFKDLHTPPGDETRCSEVARIDNISDAPVGSTSTVAVPANVSSNNPHRFVRADFPFSDVDDDTINGIHIVTLPTAGTLVRRVGASNTAVTGGANATLTLAELDTLAYYPADGATVTDDYATFTYRVRDTGTTSAPSTAVANEATADATLIIDLVSATQGAASGAPTVTPAADPTAGYDEDTELTASTDGITDPNGISNANIRWQWYRADAQTGPYAAISGANAAAFTPSQADGNMHIRVCAFFRDALNNAEGGSVGAPMLCSDGAVVTHVNDVPTSADNSVSVSVNTSATNPYIFTESDFPYRDEEGNSLDHITIVTPIASGKGTLRNGSAAVTANTEVTDDELRNGNLTFYPPDNSAAAPDFASFTFTVNDGALDSATHTMTISLAERLRLRLRLRVFLEGPLR